MADMKTTPTRISVGKQCLYINKLADVDLDVLKTIIKAGVVEAKNTWPVTPS